MSEADEKVMSDAEASGLDTLGLSWLRFDLWRAARFDAHPEDDNLNLVDLIGIYAAEEWP